MEDGASGEEALAVVGTFGPDVVLTDVRMPKMGGLDLLAKLKAKGIDSTVIVMSAYGNLDLALEGIKAQPGKFVAFGLQRLVASSNLSGFSRDRVTGGYFRGGTGPL